jgi:Ca2+/Na+ antiporter
MYADVSFIASLAMIIFGLWMLTWSANRFVDGAAELSQKFGVPPFIIGMVVIGFGTSAPEMAVVDTYVLNLFRTSFYPGA